MTPHVDRYRLRLQRHLFGKPFLVVQVEVTEPLSRGHGEFFAKVWRDATVEDLSVTTHALVPAHARQQFRLVPRTSLINPTYLVLEFLDTTRHTGYLFWKWTDVWRPAQTADLACFGSHALSLSL